MQQRTLVAEQGQEPNRAAADELIVIVARSIDFKYGGLPRHEGKEEVIHIDLHSPSPISYMEVVMHRLCHRTKASAPLADNESHLESRSQVVVGKEARV